MNYTPAAFKSPILAQKRLLGLDFKYFNFNTINNKIKDNLCEPTMPNISTVPSFNSSKAEPLRTDFGLPVAELVELFKRKAKSTYEKLLISVRGEYILSKALKYYIPFDEDDIDWLSLMDEVNEYEDIIEKGDELNIDWDYSFYDPVGLKQEIISSQHDAYLERKELQTYFYATCGMEV